MSRSCRLRCVGKSPIRKKMRSCASSAVGISAMPVSLMEWKWERLGMLDKNEKKNHKTGIIDTNKYRVNLNGAESESKIFLDLLRLLEMMVSALDECITQEEEMYENCQKLVRLKKVKPGLEIKNKTNVANVSKGCFIIPSMQFLQDNKKFYSTG